MGFKTSLAACGAAFIAYQAFQNRQNLSDRYRIEKTRLQGIVEDKDTIQDQLTIIKAELARLNNWSRNAVPCSRLSKRHRTAFTDY